jgi:PKD repeat protein
MFRYVVWQIINTSHFCSVQVLSSHQLNQVMNRSILTLLLLWALSAVAPAMAQSSQHRPANTCGFTPMVTAICTTAVGTLVPDEAVSGQLSNVCWYDDNTGEIIGYGTNLNTTLAGYGSYKIKVQYNVIGDNVVCAGSYSRQINVEAPSCIMQSPQQASMTCPEVSAPVCGCDGVVYNNECEATAAGVRTWWAGPCANQPPATTCGTTDMNVEMLSGVPGQSVTVQFENLATGSFTNMQLDFGDGQIVSLVPNWTTILHTYNAMGNYQATLSAWKINQANCISTVAKNIATDVVSFEEGAALTGVSYVLPGDTDGDHKANVYDLLQLGLGYGQIGVPRPEATTEWKQQYTPNWIQHTQQGNNLKNFDADGSGLINDIDSGPILLNYQPIDTFQTPVSPNLPVVRVDFPQDTLYLDPASPNQSLDITANLHIGSANKPVVGLYGLAAALRYPDYVAHNPVALYDPTFLGQSNFVLSLYHDDHDRQQMDVGYVKKSGSGVTGYGRIATIQMKADFIIIIDIIDRAEAKVIPFTIPLQGIKAIDSNGNEMLISPSAQPDTLWIKIKDSTSVTNQQQLNAQVRVSPNPARGEFLLATSGLLVQGVTVFNSIGQLQYESTQDLNAEVRRISVANWSPGVYTVRVITDLGAVERRIIVE